MRLKLPSPSMIVALTALVIALGGTAYAASQINGSTIKNGTIAGGKLKKDTLTGRQIKESSLGTVPSAKNATTAKTAGTATSALTAGTATNAGHATSATSATSAGTAATAGNALTLGGLAAGQFVQGGGQIYTNAVTLANGTTDSSGLAIPGVALLKVGCSGGDVEPVLTNTTGASVQESASENINGTLHLEGVTVAPSAGLFGGYITAGGQVHLTVTWPVGAPTHGADLTLGWYFDSTSSQCVVNVTGFIR